MTIFLQDLKQYLIDNNLVQADNCFVEFSPVSPTEKVVLFKYDSEAKTDENYVQFMGVSADVDVCIDKLSQIYENIFNEDDAERYVIINGNSCIFEALTKPTYMKYESNLFYYTFNVIVTVEKI